MMRSPGNRLLLGLRGLALLDESWCLQLNRGMEVRTLRLALRVVSRLGDGVFWYGLMAVLLAVEGWTAVQPVIHMAVVGVLGVASYRWLKKRTSRPRPYQVQQAIRLGATPLDAYSFPSGHMLHAAAFSIVATSYYPPLAWVVVPFSLLVALSRPVLGLHYPSDVLAGATIGAVIAVASLTLF